MKFSFYTRDSMHLTIYLELSKLSSFLKSVLDILHRYLMLQSLLGPTRYLIVIIYIR